MARLPRLYAPDAVQYLVQRTVAGRALIDADDVALLIRLLEAACRQHRFALHAYALTSSEIHLLGTPSGPTTPADVLQSIGRAFVPWINRKAGRAGALWERRYRSTIVDPELLLPVMRVIESVAARAGDDIEPGLSRSSHDHHVGLRQDALVTDHARYWALSDTPFERQAIYRGSAVALPDAQFIERIRDAVEHGWALGTPAFLIALAQVANRRTLPAKRGRPRRVKSDSDVSPIHEAKNNM